MEQRTFTSTSSLTSPDSLKTIFWAGLVSGILDAMAACIVFYLAKGFNPGQVMQYIASGCFGMTAFSGGITMISIGFILHFVIAFAIAAVYFMIFPYMKIMRTQPVISGLLLGVIAWAFMNLLVIPLSLAPKEPFNLAAAIVSIVWHMVLVGLPVALITKKHFDRGI